MIDLAISALLALGLLGTLICLIIHFQDRLAESSLLSWFFGVLLIAVLIIAGIIAEFDSAPWPTDFTITHSVK